MSYRSPDDHRLSPVNGIPSDPSHIPTHQDGAPPSLSISMLLAAANVAQANPGSYVPSSPSDFSQSLSLGCTLSTSSGYDACASSPGTTCWPPPLGLSASGSDRMAPSPPETPFDNHSVIYPHHPTNCARLESDWLNQRDAARWAMSRVKGDAVYDPKQCLSQLSQDDYSHHSLINQHHQQNHHHNSIEEVQIDLNESSQIEPQFNLHQSINYQKHPQFPSTSTHLSGITRGETEEIRAHLTVLI
ncbi:expressed protein [Phakopsora pachyrhizi]|uniref:Expressed protein n=1 Tax=Phakopsora pachyrhizi TaxID=170000 RepID=A0AAV0BLR2_PHAPC|nr:expressed protein [Phakopsora pachyrhizi]